MSTDAALDTELGYFATALLLQRLDLLQHLLDFGSQTVLVTGESGSGKSALLREAERRAAPAAFLRLRADPLLGPGPLLEQLSEALDPEQPAPGPLAEAEESFARLLREAEEDGAPVVVAVDDAHLLRAEALGLLVRLTRRGLRLLLAGEPALARSAAAALYALPEPQVAHTLDLPAFNLEETEAFLEHIGAETLLPEAERLHALSQGLPGRLVALSRAHREVARTDEFDSDAPGGAAAAPTAELWRPSPRMAAVLGAGLVAGFLVIWMLSLFEPTSRQPRGPVKVTVELPAATTGSIERSAPTPGADVSPDSLAVGTNPAGVPASSGLQAPLPPAPPAATGAADAETSPVAIAPAVASASPAETSGSTPPAGVAASVPGPAELPAAVEPPPGASQSPAVVAEVPPPEAPKPPAVVAEEPPPEAPKSPAVVAEEPPPEAPKPPAVAAEESPPRAPKPPAVAAEEPPPGAPKSPAPPPRRGADDGLPPVVGPSEAVARTNAPVAVAPPAERAVPPVADPAPAALPPPPADAARVRARDAGWLAAQDPSRWVLQLYATRERAAADRFIARHGLGNGAAVFATERDGASVHVVVYGLYATRQQALDAVGGLPAEVRRLEPWPRSIQAVKGAISVRG